MCTNIKLTSSTLNIFVLCILALIKQGLCIGCFYCVSRNNSDPTCGDPFNPAYSEYKPNCRSGKAGRTGLLPAQFCIKIVGTPVGSEEELVIRTCTLRNMNIQCGMFEFEDADDSRQLMEGCILTCDFDGCNGAYSPHSLRGLRGLLTLLSVGVCMAATWQTG